MYERDIYAVSAITSGGVTDTKSITSGALTDMKFYYQWRNNLSLKTFTRGRKQYAHYNTRKTYQLKQEVKVIWQKAPHGGPIPRLGVTPGGRKLYH